MTDAKPDPQRIRVMLKKGRNMFASAFAELNAIRKQLGDQEFSRWCLYDLRCPVTALTKYADILEDAKLTKQRLAGARKAKPVETTRLKAEIARLQAEVAHLKTNGAGYVSATDKAREAIKANPGLSDRAIAALIGVGTMTVNRARRGV